LSNSFYTIFTYKKAPIRQQGTGAWRYHPILQKKICTLFLDNGTFRKSLRQKILTRDELRGQVQTGALEIFHHMNFLSGKAVTVLLFLIIVVRISFSNKIQFFPFYVKSTVPNSEKFFLSIQKTG